MKFTPRELEICKYLILGMNNSEIAAQLYLSQHTVKAYISNIISRSGARNRTHVAYLIGKENIIDI